MTEKPNSPSGLSFFEDPADRPAQSSGDATQTMPAVSERGARRAHRQGCRSSHWCDVAMTRTPSTPSWPRTKLRSRGRSPTCPRRARSWSSCASRVAELEQKNSEQEAPTYAGLGEHAAAMLRLAEEQAAEVTASAKTNAEEMRRTPDLGGSRPQGRCREGSG